MGSKFGKLLTLAVVAAAFITVPASATPMELITNGGFEAPGLAGWSVGDQPGGLGVGVVERDGQVSDIARPGCGGGVAVGDPGRGQAREVFGEGVGVVVEGAGIGGVGVE